MGQLSYFYGMENENLQNRICSLNDSGLLELLKLRESYQDEAVTIAVAEAIKRGLISSEKDLDLPGFSSTKSHSTSFFPKLNDESQFQKVFGSLIRVLYLTAVFPLIFGALKLVEGQMPYGLILLGIGLVWVILAMQIQKHKNPQIPLVMIAVFVAALVVVIFNKTVVSSIQGIDFVVYGLAIFGVLYILIFLHIMLSRRKGQ